MVTVVKSTAHMKTYLLLFCLLYIVAPMSSHDEMYDVEALQEELKAFFDKESLTEKVDDEISSPN